MKRNFILLLMCTAFALFSTLVQATTSISFSGCDAIEATITGEIPCSDCYAQGGVAWVGSKMFVKYRLYRKSGSNWNYVQEKSNNSSTTVEFTGLSDGVYRVEGYYSQALDGICYPAYNYVGQEVGCIGTWVFDEISNEMEVGNPIVSGVLLDVSGEAGNNIFCSEDVNNQGGIYLNTAGVYGESDWNISICQKNASGGCSNWTGIGWQETPMPNTINLLTDVWQFHHSGWDFWNGTYEVQFAANKDNCTGWVSQLITFDVVTDDCRTLGRDDRFELTLFPNPATDRIQLNGLENVKGDVQYQVYNVGGQKVTEDYLLSPAYPINVEELESGMYILQLNVNNEVINKRFIIK